MLENKWYRFTGPAGTLMPTTPLKPFDCGTDAPGWMVGVHPIVDEGVVDRQVCFAWDVECQWEATIQVRNCGDYYVYRLADPPTSACATAASTPDVTRAPGRSSWGPFVRDSRPRSAGRFSPDGGDPLYAGRGDAPCT
ncbi:hypothetical protein [Nannocystis pusilla]|uniref:hypothetical protein n=1 Tax=Nannocystis pusilla TaxID=889268 RepID=UPI003B8075C4